MFRKSLIFVLLIIFTFWSYPQVMAQPNLDPKTSELESLLNTKLKKKLESATYFVFGIKDRLSESKDELVMLQSNIKSLENRIKENESFVNTLEEEVSNLDALVLSNKSKVKAIRLQIATNKNAILVLENEVEQRSTILQRQQSVMNDKIKTYYIYANTLFNTSKNEPNLLAFLSSDDSTGKVIQLHEYLLFLQQSGINLGETIQKENQYLEDSKIKLNEKKKTLVQLAALLDQEQRSLEIAQESKQRLLNETKGKQAVYETLLEISKKEQEQVSVQIERLKENYEFFMSKMSTLRGKTPEEILGESYAEFEQYALSLRGKSALAWPVSPSAGISAFFRDTSYKKALGVEHNAVDIRVIQGTKVRSAANGVVTKAIDNGFGYSYIMVAHPDKVVTLYGHISEILVSEGEVVKQGQTIGLSGGVPGSKGAGWLTTGAHLHFEVFKDFKHVDPLYYLPLEFVPVSSLPDEHVERLLKEKESFLIE